jgi:hypothetical protein
MSFEIDPRNVSNTSIYAALQTFLQVREDFSEVKNFYASDAAVIMMEMLAGFGAFESHRAIVNRREAYLRFAKIRNSAVGIASSLGYSAFRGRNRHFQMTVVPYENISFRRFDYDLPLDQVRPVGTIGDTPLYIVGIGTSYSNVFTTNSGGGDPFNTYVASPGHRFSTGDTVRGTTTGTLSEPLLPDTDYYVRVLDASTLQLYKDPDLALNNLIQYSSDNATPQNLVLQSTTEIVPIPTNGTADLIAGVPTIIEVVAGELDESELVLSSNELRVFRWETGNVSEDLALHLDTTTGFEEVPFGIDSIDLDLPAPFDKYVLQTNGFGGVDGYYLNNEIVDTLGNPNPSYPYDANDILRIRFIKNLNVTAEFPADVQFDYGFFNPTDVANQELNPTIAEESRFSIQIKAPIASEVQSTIKGRADFRKYFLTLDPRFITTNSRNVSIPVIYRGDPVEIPANVEVSYCIGTEEDPLNPGQFIPLYLQSAEKELYEGTEAEFYEDGLLNKPKTRPEGIPPARIVDPKVVNFQINLIITKTPGADFATLSADLEAIKYSTIDENGNEVLRENNLGYTLDLSKIEEDIEKLSYVRIARATIRALSYQINFDYPRGYHYNPTVDRGIIFECIRRDSGLLSTLSEPVIPAYMIPGDLLFERVPEWQPSTVYNVGDKVIPNTNPLPDPPVNLTGVIRTGFYYECISSGTSGLLQPQLGKIENEIIEDSGGLKWQTRNPYKDSDLIDDSNVGIIWKAKSANELNHSTDWNEFFLIDFGVPTVINP